MNIRVFKWLPGYVIPERDPGDLDYRLAAVLDIEELTAIIIEAILHHNNECLVSDGVEIDPDFLAEGFDPYPVQLFNWGVINRPGGLRESDSDAVRRSLLPEATASINNGEIKFRHPKAPKPLIYRCDQLVDERLLLRGTGVKGRQFTALFDLRWADEIYLLREAGGDLLPCPLRDENSIHANRDWAEVVQYLNDVKASRDRQAPAVVQAEINFDRRIRERVSKAERRLQDAREGNPVKSKATALRGIRPSRKDETNRMHEEEANQLRLINSQASVGPALESRQQRQRAAEGRTRVPRIPDIAELRKKRVGQ